MKLFFRNPACAQTMILVTHAMLQQLLQRVEGQTTKYICEPDCPQKPGICRAAGKIPSNNELAEFLTLKTHISVVDGKLHSGDDNEWHSSLMLKKAVFAKQSPISGKIASHRGVHKHYPGCTRAFAFKGYKGAKIQMRFVVPGDYFKLSVTTDDGDGVEVRTSGFGDVLGLTEITQE